MLTDTEKEALEYALCHALWQATENTTGKQKAKWERQAATLRGLIERAGWQPISTAPKDGTPLLLKLKAHLPVTNRPDLECWRGLAFVGRHNGVEPDGFDIGWMFAAPVGHGGFPDSWFAGWQPLPTPPTDVKGDV